MTASPDAIDELKQSDRRRRRQSARQISRAFRRSMVRPGRITDRLVEPTPYQRNLSDTHMRKLEGVIAKLGRFLDPIIVIRKVSATSATRYWTPNGNHRLSAMKTLGAKCIVGIVVPETAAAYQILAFNTEKAHNLRERALEVIKMYQELAALRRLDRGKLRVGVRRGRIDHPRTLLSRKRPLQRRRLPSDLAALRPISKKVA